jgi:hypothetical protein
LSKQIKTAAVLGRDLRKLEFPEYFSFFLNMSSASKTTPTWSAFSLEGGGGPMRNTKKFMAMISSVRSSTSLDALMPWFAKGARSKRFSLFMVCVALLTVGELFISAQGGSPGNLKEFVDDFLPEKEISLGFSGDQAEVYARCGSLLLDLSGKDLTQLCSLRQMRELLVVHKDDRGSAWDFVLQNLKSQKKRTLSGAFIREVIKQHPGLRRVERLRVPSTVSTQASGSAYTRALFSMENDRYGTPIFILNCVRQVLGVIDLDPFSEALFNSVVRATRFYSREENGFDRLNKPWWGSVFLNPPGGKTASGQSISGLALARAIHEWKHMTMVAAIVLIKAAIGYEWFNQSYEFPICSLYMRPSFTDPNNSENGSAPTGYVAVYLGPNPLLFKKVFLV